MGRKSNLASKEPVKIRMKELKNGNKSLFLDIYVNGVRKYEFLKLYLKPETNRENKKENQNTLSLANAIKAKRIVEIQNNRYGFSNSNMNADADILEYMVRRAEKVQKPTVSKNRGSISTAKRSAYLLRLYARKQKIPFNQVDKNFVIGYVAFLKNRISKYGRPLAENTIISLFASFVAALNSAVKDGIIDFNPANKLRSSEKPETPKPSRGYLTIDEVRKLYGTPCKRPYVKQIFLFGCMCGLRYSDIIALKWGDLHFESDGKVSIKIKQIKTGIELDVPLSKEAINLLPKERNNDDYVFGKQLEAKYVRKYLRAWAKEAGITKDVKFHTSRHTYATMLLTLGADLFTVSKLLGHVNIKTTQIYVEVINQKKQEAVDLIPSFQADK